MVSEFRERKGSTKVVISSKLRLVFVPQIALAIGVLTSNRGEGDEPLWPIGRGTRVPLQGEVDVGAIAGCHCRVPLQGAIAGCHCSVQWLGGRATANFGEWTWGHCCVPLQGAIVMCYGWGEGRVTANIGNTKIGFAIWGLCWCNFFGIIIPQARDKVLHQPPKKTIACSSAAPAPK